MNGRKSKEIRRKVREKMEQLGRDPKGFKFYCRKARALFTCLILLICSTAYADKIQVPFQCYPQKIQAEFQSEGLNLSLSDTIREKDTWGFLRNQGNKYEIETYYSVTLEEFDLIQQITMRVEIWQRQQ